MTVAVAQNRQAGEMQIQDSDSGARIDGIFDYWTLASVRLFQEYIRTVEGIDIGIADGRVGRGTHEHMMRCEENDIIYQLQEKRRT